MNFVYKSLLRRIDRVDESRTYSLHKEITTLQQGTASVAAHYTKLRNLWDEYEALMQFPTCDYEKSRGFNSSWD